MNSSLLLLYLCCNLEAEYAGYELSLNCDIPDVGVEFISKHNNYQFHITEMFLECKTSTGQFCVSVRIIAKYYSKALNA